MENPSVTRCVDLSLRGRQSRETRDRNDTLWPLVNEESPFWGDTVPAHACPFRDSSFLCSPLDRKLVLPCNRALVGVQRLLANAYLSGCTSKQVAPVFPGIQEKVKIRPYMLQKKTGSDKRSDPVIKCCANQCDLPREGLPSLLGFGRSLGGSAKDHCPDQHSCRNPK